MIQANPVLRAPCLGDLLQVRILIETDSLHVLPERDIEERLAVIYQQLFAGLRHIVPHPGVFLLREGDDDGRHAFGILFDPTVHGRSSLQYEVDVVIGHTLRLEPDRITEFGIEELCHERIQFQIDIVVAHNR